MRRDLIKMIVQTNEELEALKKIGRIVFIENSTEKGEINNEFSTKIRGIR